jgi:Ankyrin repeats (3 copies)
MGASVNAQTEYGYPGLHIAASGPQRLELIQLLLSSGADVHSLTGDRETLLHVACVAGGPDVAEFLLQDPDFDYLSRRCDGATPESLLKRGGTLHHCVAPRSGELSCTCACAEGSVAKAKILKLLQERKRRDEIKSWNVRMMSMEDHAVKRVRRLLDEKGAWLFRLVELSSCYRTRPGQRKRSVK